VATGGNIEALAKMASAPLRSGGFRDLTAADLATLLNRLPAMSLKTRMARFGIGPDRADVVVPAAVVYAHLAFLSGQTRLRVPELGTKEGILFDLVDRLTLNSDYIFRLEKQLMQLTVSLGRRYQFDEAHGRQVCRLALQLFEELAPLHGLDPGDHRVLLVASLLHDIGTYISFKKHHKHSQYLIAQSELPGMNAGDMNVAAHVARYHRKNTPQLEHESFARLEKSERRRVTRLAALLRIADALDRDHAQTVRRLKARIRRPYLELKLEGLRGGRLEPWALRRKAKLFSEVFGLRVRIVT
jgi:exopolyphosphatase/guanosine-5'-triphosphate,3'-diphosphate pyrophosphatase